MKTSFRRAMSLSSSLHRDNNRKNDDNNNNNNSSNNRGKCLHYEN